MLTLAFVALALKLTITSLSSESKVRKTCFKVYDKISWSCVLQAMDYVYILLAIGSALNARDLSFDSGVLAISSLLTFYNAFVVVIYPIWLIQILRRGFRLEADN